MTPTRNVDERLNIKKEISQLQKYMAMTSWPLLIISYLIFRFYQIREIGFRVENMVQ